MTADTHGRMGSIFERCRTEGRVALMPFVCAGDPSLEQTRDALLEIQSAGADAVEIGIPFSDPIADGPVIAASMHKALQHGTTPEGVFDMVRAIRDDLTMGLIAMVSASIVTRHDAAEFIAEAAEAGFDGLIVPDLDAAAAQPLADAAAGRGMSFTMLVAPNGTPDRIRAVTDVCRGFVYGLARLGITGEQSATPDVGGLIERVRATTDLPVAVGFGISTAAHVQAVAKAGADAAIVGSALVRRMSDAPDAAARAGAFVRELAGGVAAG